MTSDEKDELLIRIDERVGTLHSAWEEIRPVVAKTAEIVTKHQTYFRIIGWVVSSGTILSILGKGIFAYVKSKH